MTSYWTGHKPEIIVWTVVGVWLLLFFVWSFWPRPIRDPQIVTPSIRPRVYSVMDDIELSPPPRAFVPAPLYEQHERDVWLPNNLELEKRDDGYYYPSAWR